MTETNTLPYPAEISVSTDPPDELTQAELERLIDIARKVKGGRGVTCGCFRVVNGRLFIEGLRRAA